MFIHNYLFKLLFVEIIIEAKILLTSNISEINDLNWVIIHKLPFINNYYLFLVSSLAILSSL